MSADHLDLDALADLSVGEGDDAARAHAAGCAACTARLAELADADAAVTRALAALPAPVVPGDVAARLDAALRAAAEEGGDDAAAPRAEEAGRGDAAAGITTLPVGTARRRAPAWLPAAAAAVVLVAGGALGAAALGDRDAPQSGALSAAGESAGLARNATGNQYTAGGGELAAALPGLLRGNAAPLDAAEDAAADAAGESTAQAPAPAAVSESAGRSSTGGSVLSAQAGDPLERLREPAALASCLAGLLPQDDDELRPLALDYAAWEGSPALVVVLPVPEVPSKVDVYVVGPQCRLGEEDVLHFTRLDRPRG